MAPATALFAAGKTAAVQQAATGAVNGVAKNAAGKALPRMTVQLRNVADGQLAGTTTSGAAGQFSFAGLAPGSYTVEVVNAAGQIVGTSATITVAAGATVSGVSVAATTAAVAGGVGGGLSTAAIIGIIAAGAGVVTAIAVAQNGSPSK